MGRFGRNVLVLGVLLAACSGGGGSAQAPSTTTTTATTAPTTSTTTVEDAVKEAYLAYWKMIDRLNESPNPNDPELSSRVLDPFLSEVRDELTSQASTGHSYT